MTVLSLLGCNQGTEEFCLKCVETFYRDEAGGKIANGGYFYKTIFLREVTTIECNDDYVGPYKINGQADDPQDGTDFNWSYKECEDQ